MFHIGRRAHLRLGLVLEVHLQGLDLLVPASRLVGGILQRTDFGLGVPLQLCCNYLRICSVFVFFFVCGDLLVRECAVSMRFVSVVSCCK